MNSLQLPVAVVLLLVSSIACDQANRHPFQRLIQPGGGTRMTLAPGLCVPNMNMNTVESAMEFRMPISVNFPTAGEVAASMINQMFSMNVPHASREDSEGASSSSTGNGTTPSSGNKSSRASRAMKSRIAARSDFYKTIEKAHPTFGKACLLRAICEVSEIPFVSSHTGFIGEMFDILLTASPLLDREGKLTDYIKAEQVGRRSLMEKTDNCKQKYSDCPFSLFKVAQLANNFL